jgi:hypothetical protein
VLNFFDILRHLATSAASDFARDSPTLLGPNSFVGQVVWQALLRRSPTRIGPETWRSMPFVARLTERRRAFVPQYCESSHDCKSRWTCSQNLSF